MANWRKELRDLTRRDPEVGSGTAAVNEAVHTAESDRGAALIAGSTAENSIEQILRMQLVALNKQQIDDLFGPDGIMGSFSAKIKIAFAFGLIDKKLSDEADRIREIRNAFAHCKCHIDFNTQEVKRACDGFSFMPPVMVPVVGHLPRQRYIHACYTIMYAATEMMEILTEGGPFNLPISGDNVVASRERSFLQFLQQTPPDHS